MKKLPKTETIFVYNVNFISIHIIIFKLKYVYSTFSLSNNFLCASVRGILNTTIRNIDDFSIPALAFMVFNVATQKKQHAEF